MNTVRMQIYRKPKGKWDKLARKYRTLREICAGSYRGSPIIELDDHQYMEVEYFGSYDGTGPFPHVKVRGVIVLRDAHSAESNPLVIKKIIRLGTLLLDLIHDRNVRYLEHAATFEKRETQAKLNFSGEIGWFRQQQAILCRYVSNKKYAVFLHTSEQKRTAMQQMSDKAAKMLQIISAILQCQIVPAKLVESLDRVSVRIQQWNVQNSRALVERGNAAKQLYKELLNQRKLWIKETAISETCERALRVWQTIARAAEQAQQRLEKSNCTEFSFEQRKAAALQQRIEEMLTVYRAPLVEVDRTPIAQRTDTLPDTTVDQMIASLPPLPEPPPWRSGKAQVERIAVRILGGICVIAALAGAAFNIWLMLREKPSFSNIGNALFFASWLFITSQYLKRHY